MIHIENKTGKSYPITQMTEEHLSRTIDLLLSRCEKINAVKDHNPRYISDMEGLFDRLSKYVFVAEMQGTMKYSTKLRLIEEYDKYHNERASVYTG